MRKSKFIIAGLMLATFTASLFGVALNERSLSKRDQQQQAAPRKYVIKPMNLGTTTEIRARSTRTFQVQVTDDNDHPIPDVPLILLLAGMASGKGAAATLTGQTSLRAVTNSYGIANVNFTAPDLVGSTLRLQVQVEGTDVMWNGSLNIARPAPPPQPNSPPESINANAVPALEAEEKACFDLINQFRAENQQPPVSLSAKLMKAAQWLSHDNADNKPDDPDHTDSLGRDAGKRLADFGYEAIIIKENIVVGAETAAQAMQVWKESGFHVRNLANADVRVVGISRMCKKGAKYGCHWTVILGSTED